jgi:hypothetical protein
MSVMMHSEPDWRPNAVCRNYDPELWFEENKFPLALKICASCPVKVQCRELADRAETSELETHGIFGGETPGQRIIRRNGKSWIVDRIRNDMKAGRWGTKLPRRKDLASYYRTSYAIINEVMRVLNEEKIIEFRRSTRIVTTTNITTEQIPS